MINFTEVTRAKSKARIAVTGPSGSGKTLSSLYLAFGLTNDWSKIALIDTEHERGRFYAKRSDLNTGEFLYASMIPPYTPDTTAELIKVEDFKLDLKTPDDCHSYADLLEYAEKHGYKTGWAYYQAKRRGMIA